MVDQESAACLPEDEKIAAEGVALREGMHPGRKQPEEEDEHSQRYQKAAKFHPLIVLKTGNAAYGLSS